MLDSIKLSSSTLYLVSEEPDSEFLRADLNFNQYNSPAVVSTMPRVKYKWKLAIDILR